MTCTAFLLISTLILEAIHAEEAACGVQGCPTATSGNTSMIQMLKTNRIATHSEDDEETNAAELLAQMENTARLDDIHMENTSNQQIFQNGAHVYIKQPGHGTYLGMCGVYTLCGGSKYGVYGYPSKSSRTEWVVETSGSYVYLKQPSHDAYLGMCGIKEDCDDSKYGIYGYASKESRTRWVIETSGSNTYLKQPDHNAYPGMCGVEDTCSGSKHGVYGYGSRKERTIFELAPRQPSCTELGGVDTQSDKGKRCCPKACGNYCGSSNCHIGKRDRGVECCQGGASGRVCDTDEPPCWKDACTGLSSGACTNRFDCIWDPMRSSCHATQYVLVSHGAFDSHPQVENCPGGKNAISSLEECSRAAKKLGLSDATAETNDYDKTGHQNGHTPRGCWLDTQQSKLYMNPTLIAWKGQFCRANQICVCKQAR